MVCGLWFAVCGLWFVVCGLWFVVCGLRFVVCGLRFVIEIGPNVLLDETIVVCGLFLYQGDLG